MLTRMDETEELTREVLDRAEHLGDEKRVKKRATTQQLGEEKDNVVRVDLKLNSLFAGMTIKAFPTPPLGSVFTIRSDATILDALRQLVAKNFLSAPVEDVGQPKTADCLLRYPGLISLSDIVTFVTAPLVDKEQHNQEEAVDTFLDYMEQAQNVESVTVGDLIEKKKEKVEYAGLVPMFEGKTTFLDALNILGSHKNHRFIVFSEDKKEIRNIVTQGAMCRVLQQKLKEEYETQTPYAQILQNTTLKNVGLGNTQTQVTVECTQPTLDAFVKIGRHQFGGLPVVETSLTSQRLPKLRGNISARDIRSVLVNPSEGTRMFEPVSKFLEHMRGEKFTKPQKKVVCKTEDSLASVLEKVVGQNIHRVYLVDDEMGLRRVITLSDLLGRLISRS